MTKKINEYTNAELLKLNDDEVETIIKLHMAEEGIKLLKRPQEPVYAETPKPDVRVWQVAGCEFYFTDRAIAEEIAKVMYEHISEVNEREWSATAITIKGIKDGYRYQDGIPVTESGVYSRELLDQISTKLKMNKEAKESYEKLSNEYNKIEESAESIRADVWNVVRMAKEAQAQKERLTEIFQEYLLLADDNVDVAWKFMNKAYAVSKEEVDYINAHIKGKKAKS